MDKVTLNTILKSKDAINNLVLKKDLELLLSNNEHGNIIYNYSNLSLKTYQYLLSRNHIKATTILNIALSTKPCEKHDKLLDLALINNINFETMNYFPGKLSLIDLEKCLNHGLSINQAAKLILSYSHPSNDDDAILNQLKLVDYLARNGAKFSESYWIPQYFPKKTYEFLLKHGLKTQTLLRTSIEIEAGEKHDQLLALALENKIDFSQIAYLLDEISITDLKKCLKHGLSYEFLVKEILNKTMKVYEPGNNEYSKAYLTKKQLEILNIARDDGISFNKIFQELIKDRHVTKINSIQKLSIIPEKILETLIKNYSLNPSLVLEYSIIYGITSLAEFALSNNANPNFTSEKNLNLIARALIAKNLKMADLLIENGAVAIISIEYYIALLREFDFNYATKVIKKFPHLYSSNQLYETFRAFGLSNSETRNFLDLHDLMKEYLEAKSGNITSLSQEEINILEGIVSLKNIDALKEVQFSNKYGYGPLHLSIIGNQYSLATNMIRNGFDIYKKTHNNITALQLIKEYDLNIEFINEILKVIDNVDVPLMMGETLADKLITNPYTAEQTIELSNDSLFYLFKKDADLFTASKDLSKAYIAISHGENFWSTGIWSTSRLITENYPNVKFYLVKEDILKKGGESFLKQFDGVINPGAEDSYPNSDEFKKEDCPFNMDIENHYQNILDLSYKYNIPYLGICAGAQHFSMYHGGTLSPLVGYSSGQHQISYIEGTLAYFMASTKEQQKNAFNNCEFAKISFKSDTAHHYAAVATKLGNKIQLGAVSEGGVAMSYAHENGIRYATQFHPEHFYYNKDNEHNANQKAWINNFVEIAIMHHNHRTNSKIHPTKYFEDIKLRLQECIINPTCLTENSLDLYKELFLI